MIRLIMKTDEFQPLINVKTIFGSQLIIKTPNNTIFYELCFNSSDHACNPDVNWFK